MVKRSSAAKPKAKQAGGAGKRCYTIEQMVAKKLLDNFKGWGPQDTDVRCNSRGMTLRQVLLADMQAHKEGRDPRIMGALYYQNLKTEFKSDQGRFSQLSVKDPTLAVSPALVKAIYATRRAHPERSEICAYLQTCTLPNQSEVVGLCRYFSQLRPRCIKQLAAAMDACRFLARLKIADKYPEEYGIIKPWVDEALEQALIRSRANKTPDTVFCEIHRELLGLVLRLDDLDRVSQCGGNWVGVSEYISNLVASSQTGYRLFLVAIEAVIACKVAQVIADRISSLLAQKKSISVEAAKLHERDTQQLVSEIDSLDMLPARRTIALRCLGEPVSIKVQSYQEQVQMSYAASIKSVGVAKASLKKLWVEDMFVNPGGDGGVAATFPKAHFVSANVARERLSQLISDNSATTGDLVRHVVGKFSKDLLLTDPSFKVELSIIDELVSDSGGARMQRAIIRCLPTLTTHMAPEEAAQRLHILRAGAWFQIADRSSQEKCKVVQSLVNSLVEAKPPDMADALNSPYMATIVAQFEFFLKSSSESGSSMANSKIGRTCIPGLIDEAAKGVSAGTAKLETLMSLRAYAWLMKETELQKVEALIAQIEEARKADVGEAARKRQKVKGPSASSQGDCDKAMKQCLDMFK